MNLIYNTLRDFNQYRKQFFALIIVSNIVLITILTKHSSYFVSKKNQNKINETIDRHHQLETIDRYHQSEVLLIYVYSKTHSHAYGNIKYFIEHTVQENDGVDYYFILQNVDNKTVNESEMPLLPKTNAHYIQHENVCYDFGTVGWFFRTYTVGNPWINQTIDHEKKINITQYKYFIMINSSIRGPFFPPYYLKFLIDYKEEFQKTFYWYYVFTKRLNDKVKLTGCTISCIPIPHVQSYFMATDFIGLTLLLQPNGGGSEGVFACHQLKIHASFHSEVPSSTRILDAGYMIDCVLTKYQTINFKEPHNQLCNRHRNPYEEYGLDGTQVEPYEVIFMKYNDTPDTQVGRRRCEVFEKWMEDAQKQNRSSW